MLKIIFINTVSNSSLINQWKTFVRKGTVILRERAAPLQGFFVYTQLTQIYSKVRKNVMCSKQIRGADFKFSICFDA